MRTPKLSLKHPHLALYLQDLAPFTAFTLQWLLRLHRAIPSIALDEYYEIFHEHYYIAICYE